MDDRDFIIAEYKELVKRQALEIAHLDEQLKKLMEENELLERQLAIRELPPINTPAPSYPGPITIPVPGTPGYKYKGWWEYPTPYCLCKATDKGISV